MANNNTQNHANYRPGTILSASHILIHLSPQQHYEVENIII